MTKWIALSAELTIRRLHPFQRDKTPHPQKRYLGYETKLQPGGGLQFWNPRESGVTSWLPLLPDSL